MQSQIGPILALTGWGKAPEAAGGRWERQGDGGHALERESKTGNGQWLQEVVIGDGWGSEGQ